MISVHLTPQQFFYLQAAIKRDEAELEEMAPWDIDCETVAHADDLKRCREVGRLLSKVEQEQVVTH
jgi:chaperonin cofactor prefoldin